MLLGSLRADGISARAAKALSRLAPPTLALRVVPIGQLPLYNPELEENGTHIASWSAFRETVSQVDGVLFVTPEYNRSVPASLKNAIDVGSRPYGQSVWSGKPAGIVSVSPGSVGGFGANHHLRQSLVFLDMPALQQPEAYIGNAGPLFESDGTVTSEGTSTYLAGFMAAFDRWVGRFPTLDNRETNSFMRTSGRGLPAGAALSKALQLERYWTPHSCLTTIDI